MKEFDLVVIGSGPGGYVGAIRAAQLGLKTAVVEKSKKLGGTCLNVGCIPSKALLESSEHYDFAQKELKNHGVSAQNVSVDLKTMMKRKSKIVSDLNQGVDFLFKKNKISPFYGTGQLKSHTEVEVLTEQKKEVLKTKNIMIATGSEPVELPFAPWDKKVCVSSTEALSFTEIPQHLVVIGGGFIGLEMGSIWNRLGSQVTVIETSPTLCPSLDKDLSQTLLKCLQKQNMKFKLGCKVTQVEVKNNQGKVTLSLANGQTETLTANKVLVSVGRKPYTRNLGLQNLNIATNKQGQIEVDNHLRTNHKNVFAIGDAIAGPMLAHKAEEEGVAVAEFIATGWGHVNYQTIPSVIYTWPEAASVGQTEEQLKEQNIPYNKGSFPFLANGRAKSLGCTEGFVKTLAHKQSDKLLGLHILGPRAGDLISEAIVTMEFEGNSEDLARSFHAHPTLSEAVRESALAVHKRARQF